jgi:hypothetical protein
MKLACMGLLESLTVAAIFAPLSVGVLTLPACLAVRRLMERRFATSLVREVLDEWAALVAALCASCAAVGVADGIAAAAIPAVRDPIAAGQLLLVFFAPAPLGAAPWAAGELVGGESERQGTALACSIATAFAVNLGALALLPCPGMDRVWTLRLQFSLTAFAAAAATGAYLAVRGPNRKPAPPEAIALQRMLSDYSSSMSENRSLRGSSGFFCGAGAGCCAAAGAGCAGCGAGLAVCGGAPREGAGASG